MEALSLETAREVSRAECIEEVRAGPGSGDEGSEVSVVRREDGGLGEDVAGRAEVESSLEEELALEVFMVERALPWRLEGGGGGGAFDVAEGCEVGSWP